MSSTLSAAIWSAVITGVFLVICQIIISKTTMNKEKTEQLVRQQKLDDKLDQIDRKLEEHNHYASLFADLTQSIKLMEKDIGYLKDGMFTSDSNNKKKKE